MLAHAILKPYAFPELHAQVLKPHAFPAKEKAAMEQFHHGPFSRGNIRFQCNVCEYMPLLVGLLTYVSQKFALL